MSINNNQQGFTVGSVLLVVVLIAGVYFMARYVSGVNQENKKQADLIRQAANGEPGGKDMDDPSYDNDELPKDTATQPKLREYPIKSVEVDIDVLTVTLTATIPGVFVGKCTARISLPDGSESTRYIEPLTGSRTCSIYIPRSKLAAGNIWKFQLGFFSDDGRAYGNHPASTFNLQGKL